MDRPKGNAGRDNTGRFLRFVSFAVLATAGMAAIGIAVLAQPLADHYTNRAVLRAQRQRIDQLEMIHTQQAELLANAHTPAVIERQAISRLNYAPADSDAQAGIPLPSPWPNLQAALQQIGQSPAAPPVPPHYHLFIRLADRPTTQLVLLLLGAALVLIATTCFNRQRYIPESSGII